MAGAASSRSSDSRITGYARPSQSPNGLLSLCASLRADGGGSVRGSHPVHYSPIGAFLYVTDKYIVYFRLRPGRALDMIILFSARRFVKTNGVYHKRELHELSLKNYLRRKK